MITLYEMPNTVVWLKTKEEDEEYRKMCHEVGWKWSGGQSVLDNSYFQDRKYFCMVLRDNLAYASLDFYKDNEYTILTFPQLKKRLAKKKKVDYSSLLIQRGLEKKSARNKSKSTKPRYWVEVTPYMISSEKGKSRWQVYLCGRNAYKMRTPFYNNLSHANQQAKRLSQALGLEFRK